MEMLVAPSEPINRMLLLRDREEGEERRETLKDNQSSPLHGSPSNQTELHLSVMLLTS